MNPTAFISDVHSDSSALRRVLSNIDARGIETVVCLGDMVGRGGSDPKGVIDLVRDRCSLFLLGCEEDALLHGNPDFNPLAQAAVNRCRAVLDPREDVSGMNRGRLDFLASLRPVARFHHMLLVHASPDEPLHGYLLAHTAARDPNRIAAAFSKFDGLGIGGHTHVPGVFLEGPTFIRPETVNGKIRLGSRQAFVQVGSVGRPQDGTGLSCYAVIDDSGVEWVHVR